MFKKKCPWWGANNPKGQANCTEYGAPFTPEHPEERPVYEPSEPTLNESAVILP